MTQSITENKYLVSELLKFVHVNKSLRYNDLTYEVLKEFKEKFVDKKFVVDLKIENKDVKRLFSFYSPFQFTKKAIFIIKKSLLNFKK